MQKTKLLNPRTWFTSELPKTETSLAPINNSVTIPDERGRDAEVVSGTFVPTINATGFNDAHKHVERLRTTIESFNEDRQTPLKWLVVKFFEVLAYLAPVLIAWVVGMAIGDAWGGKFNLSQIPHG